MLREEARRALDGEGGPSKETNLDNYSQRDYSCMYTLVGVEAHGLE